MNQCSEQSFHNCFPFWVILIYLCLARFYYQGIYSRRAPVDLCFLNFCLPDEYPHPSITTILSPCLAPMSVVHKPFFSSDYHHLLVPGGFFIDFFSALMVMSSATKTVLCLLTNLCTFYFLFSPYHINQDFQYDVEKQRWEETSLPCSWS